MLDYLNPPSFYQHSYFTFSTIICGFCHVIKMKEPQKPDTIQNMSVELDNSMHEMHKTLFTRIAFSEILPCGFIDSTYEEITKP